MSWMLHHTYIKWGWQCSNCNIIKRMNFLSVQFIVFLFSFHVPSLWFQMPFYFLVFVFLSCTCHFLSCSFHLPLIFMSCHFGKKKRISTHVRFIFLFMIFHACLCFFSVFYFFQHFSIFFSRYFILMHFISFHFPFMCVIFHVLPLSVHILSLSLHVMSKIS